MVLDMERWGNKVSSPFFFCGQNHILSVESNTLFRGTPELEDTMTRYKAKEHKVAVKVQSKDGMLDEVGHIWLDSLDDVKKLIPLEPGNPYGACLYVSTSTINQHMFVIPQEVFTYRHLGYLMKNLPDGAIDQSTIDHWCETVYRTATPNRGTSMDGDTNLVINFHDSDPKKLVALKLRLGSSNFWKSKVVHASEGDEFSLRFPRKLLTNGTVWDHVDDPALHSLKAVLKDHLQTAIRQAFINEVWDEKQPVGALPSMSVVMDLDSGLCDISIKTNVRANEETLHTIWSIPIASIDAPENLHEVIDQSVRHYDAAKSVKYKGTQCKLTVSRLTEHDSVNIFYDPENPEIEGWSSQMSLEEFLNEEVAKEFFITDDNYADALGLFMRCELQAQYGLSAGLSPGITYVPEYEGGDKRIHFVVRLDDRLPLWKTLLADRYAHLPDGTKTLHIYPNTSGGRAGLVRLLPQLDGHIGETYGIPLDGKDVIRKAIERASIEDSARIEQALKKLLGKVKEVKPVNLNKGQMDAIASKLNLPPPCEYTKSKIRESNKNMDTGVFSDMKLKEFLDNVCDFTATRDNIRQALSTVTVWGHTGVTHPYKDEMKALKNALQVLQTMGGWSDMSISEAVEMSVCHQEDVWAGWAKSELDTLKSLLKISDDIDRAMGTTEGAQQESNNDKPITVIKDDPKAVSPILSQVNTLAQTLFGASITLNKESTAKIAGIVLTNIAFKAAEHYVERKAQEALKQGKFNKALTAVGMNNKTLSNWLQKKEKNKLIKRGIYQGSRAVFLHVMAKAIEVAPGLPDYVKAGVASHIKTVNRLELGIALAQTGPDVLKFASKMLTDIGALDSVKDILTLKEEQ